MRYKMSFICLACIFALCSSVFADVVTDWNNIALDTIKTNMLVTTKASRVLAMVHAAIFDAVNAIDKSYKYYHVRLEASDDASLEAAAVSAAHRVLVLLFPQQQAGLDNALSSSLSTIPDGAAKTEGIDLGIESGDSIVQWRQDDHSSDVVPYVPGNQPGEWRPTPPGYQPAMLPNWAIVTPFAMKDNSQFRPVPPPRLHAGNYVMSFNEVKRIGAKNSAIRTSEQTAIASFWVDMPGTITTAGRWNKIAQSVSEMVGNDVVENARLFALLNIALADAGIVAWDCKYNYNFWRPITAIVEADTDGNKFTAADPSWEPLVATPAFQSYVSAHSTFSAAAARILALFFGDDNINFNIEPYMPMMMASRTYDSFSAAAKEAGVSRIYAGIHYKFDDERGQLAGKLLSTYVWVRYMRPTHRF